MASGVTFEWQGPTVDGIYTYWDLYVFAVNGRAVDFLTLTNAREHYYPDSYDPRQYVAINRFWYKQTVTPASPSNNTKLYLSASSIVVYRLATRVHNRSGNADMNGLLVPLPDRDGFWWHRHFNASPLVYLIPDTMPDIYTENTQTMPYEWKMLAGDQPVNVVPVWNGTSLLATYDIYSQGGVNTYPYGGGTYLISDLASGGDYDYRAKLFGRIGAAIVATGDDWHDLDDTGHATASDLAAGWYSSVSAYRQRLDTTDPEATWEDRGTVSSVLPASPGAGIVPWPRYPTPIPLNDIISDQYLPGGYYAP